MHGGPRAPDRYIFLTYIFELLRMSRKHFFLFPSPNSVPSWFFRLIFNTAYKRVLEMLKLLNLVIKSWLFTLETCVRAQNDRINIQHDLIWSYSEFVTQKGPILNKTCISERRNTSFSILNFDFKPP